MWLHLLSESRIAVCEQLSTQVPHRMHSACFIPSQLVQELERSRHCAEKRFHQHEGFVAPVGRHEGHLVEPAAVTHKHHAADILARLPVQDHTRLAG